MSVPESIICVDCGEPAYLIQAVGTEDTLQPGDIVSYRCSACLDRWDVELTEEDVSASSPTADEIPPSQ